LKQRSGGIEPGLNKTASHDSHAHGGTLLGLPAEPGKDIDEIIAEVRAEMDKQKARRGSRGVAVNKAS